MKIIINGKFLAQRTTGVQRVAREITKHIDQNLDKWGNNTYCIFVPKKTSFEIPKYKNIKIIFVSGKGTYYWEQIKLFFAFKKEKGDFLLNPCNIAPLLLKDKNLIFIHDLAFLYNPESFSWKFRTIYKIFIKREAHTCKHIFTVSKFSQTQIQKTYNVSCDKISIINNGVSTFFMPNGFCEDENLKQLVKTPFFFSVGSISKNKNMVYIINLAKSNPNYNFVISGAKSKVFNKNKNTVFPTNLFYTGYISDKDLTFLYSKCFGFIFPSFFEGFGLPPLEAIGCGCRKIIVSNIPTMREIFENYNVNFIDPLSNHDNVCSFSKTLTQKEANDLIQKYNWNSSITLLLKSIK